MNFILEILYKKEKNFFLVGNSRGIKELELDEMEYKKNAKFIMKFDQS